jgi:mono/diheme cytochrome c family protein
MTQTPTFRHGSVRAALSGFAVLVYTGLAPAGEPGASAEVRALYKQRCQRCHEADGAGDGEAPNFTDSRWQRSRTDAQLLVGILDGLGTAMPAFRGRITESQARELVAFVRAFDAATAAAAADFAARFRLLQDELEILKKQFHDLSEPAGKTRGRLKTPAPEERTAPVADGPARGCHGVRPAAAGTRAASGTAARPASASRGRATAAGSG